MLNPEHPVFDVPVTTWLPDEQEETGSLYEQVIEGQPGGRGVGVGVGAGVEVGAGVDVGVVTGHRLESEGWPVDVESAQPLQVSLLGSQLQ